VAEFNGVFNMIDIGQVDNNDGREVYKKATATPPSGGRRRLAQQDDIFLYYWRAYNDWRISYDNTQSTALVAGLGQHECPTAVQEWNYWDGQSWIYDWAIKVVPQARMTAEWMVFVRMLTAAQS